MLEPKEITVDNKKYLIHKFPAMQGILLVGRVPNAMAITLENLEESKSVWNEVFSYVAVPIAHSNNAPLFLTTDELINNHVRGWKQMTEIFREIMRYNDGFLPGGSD